MKTIVYVDGFNLYYGSLRRTPFKWLDICRLSEHLLPRNDIIAIKYFTAFVKARSDDPQLAIRQQTYLRALRTSPKIEIILGHFLFSSCRMPLKEPIAGLPNVVEVLKTEEKGSDVNIATHLLCDGFRDKMDCAVVITNDSDLCAPVRILKEELRISIGIINPHRNPSRHLREHAGFTINITTADLQQCQLPRSMEDAHGTITKPQQW